VHLTKFHRLGYRCAKNYEIWWKFDKVLTKTSWVIFGTPCSYCKQNPKSKLLEIVGVWLSPNRRKLPFHLSSQQLLQH